MKKNIKFIPKREHTIELVPNPQKATKYIPDWYRNAKREPSSENRFDTGIKGCMPFFDAISAGYMQETWCEINVEKSKKTGEVRVMSSMDLIPIVGARESVAAPNMIGKDFYNIEFVWQTQWSTRLPKGYSVLITHPLNRMDLPFFTLSGIIDSDVFYNLQVGNHPFYIKKDFEGIIPIGTPMYQIIPIKRESWQSGIEMHKERDEVRQHRIRKVFFNSYKRMYWQKKSYS